MVTRMVMTMILVNMEMTVDNHDDMKTTISQSADTVRGEPQISPSTIQRKREEKKHHHQQQKPRIAVLLWGPFAINGIRAQALA